MPRVVLLSLLLASLTGCNLLNGYVRFGEHFPHGSIEKVQLSKSVRRAHANLMIILPNRQFSIRKSEVTDEEGQIHAEKGGLNYIFDIKSVGTGSEVKMEADQAGNGGDLWGIVVDLKAFP